MLGKASDVAVNSNSSLSDSQLTQLKQLTCQYSPLQLAWASGYLAAKSELPANSNAVSPQLSVKRKLTVLYGSQTGNAKAVAEQVARAAEQAELVVELYNMADYKPKNLKEERLLVIVASTNGEGEPPDDAMALHEFLASKRAPKLSNLEYAVLALGDASYQYFCQTGKDFDQRLSALGATPLFARIDCDVDYQQQADQWRDLLIEHVAELTHSESSQSEADVVTLPVTHAPVTELYNKHNPFTATVIENQKITGRDSNKTVHHIEIDLSGSGLVYQPGDALGVWPVNNERLVMQIIDSLRLNADAKVSMNQQEHSLKHALVHHKEVTLINKALLQRWAQCNDNESLKRIIQDEQQCRAYLSSTQLLDVVKQYPITVSAQGFVDMLANLAPRLYSIASSQQEVEDEVHLTVGLVEYYNKDKQRRLGAASGFLIEQLNVDDSIRVFVEHNHNFRLPHNDDIATIMIGAGTGIAPYRGFLQERDARQATAANWLFFGEQTFTQDFLYQTEWQAYLKSGLLSKIDVAFSRDQQHKIYVQDQLRLHGREIYLWLEQGAHLYVCGDMHRMAKGVHAVLQSIISEHGNMSADAAEQYLKQLRIAKRYQKDVY